MEKKMSILMQAWSVQAILDDLKTQTRRPIMPQPQKVFAIDNGEIYAQCDAFGAESRPIKCRYGKVGDELYVKETFYAYGTWKQTGKLTKKLGNPKWEFVDLTVDSPDFDYKYADHPPERVKSGISDEIGWHKRPGVFMPFVASRLGIKITHLRAERIKSISCEDIEAEGIKPRSECWGLGHMKSALRHDFKKLWNSINEERGFGFDTNALVWAITFDKFLLKNGEKIST